MRWMLFLVLPLLLATCKDSGSSESLSFSGYSRLSAMKAFHKIQKNLIGNDDNQAACTLLRHEIRWLLSALGKQKQKWVVALLESAGVHCGEGKGTISGPCTRTFFEHMESLAARCEKADPAAAAYARRFLTWQGRFRVEWGQHFFSEAKILLKSPYREETALVLFGAVRHASTLIGKKQGGDALTAFIRLLGFPCPQLSSTFSESGTENPGSLALPPKNCLPTCKKARIREPLFNFSQRKKLVIAACTPRQVGLSQKSDMEFLSPDNYLLFSSAAFFRDLAKEYLASGSPLIKANLPWILAAMEKFNKLAVPISLPDPL
ncbi:hypothetical protein KJ865_07090, partial [Myxococcota bacterium]|nr:hypothetical protein [Myxococcota bacterium]